MHAPIRAILFDFDGVLVNSEMIHFRAFQRVGKDAGIEITEEEYFREAIGFDDRGVWKQIAKAHDVALSQATLLQLMAYKSQVMRELLEQKAYSALPGVGGLVRGLWRNYPLAIVSGALREEIEIMCEGIGLRDCFRVIVAAEDVSKGKPNPEGYLQACEELTRLTGKPIKPANALIFEDAPRVIEQAKKAGFQTVGVPTAYGHDDLKADFAIKSMQIEDVKRAVPGLRFFESK
jgi:HAD superfamily hydrolase (TIGR01509 family)